MTGCRNKFTFVLFLISILSQKPSLPFLTIFKLIPDEGKRPIFDRSDVFINEEFADSQVITEESRPRSRNRRSRSRSSSHHNSSSRRKSPDKIRKIRRSLTPLKPGEYRPDYYRERARERSKSREKYRDKPSTSKAFQTKSDKGVVVSKGPYYYDERRKTIKSPLRSRSKSIVRYEKKVDRDRNIKYRSPSPRPSTSRRSPIRERKESSSSLRRRSRSLERRRSLEKRRSASHENRSHSRRSPRRSPIRKRSRSPYRGDNRSRRRTPTHKSRSRSPRSRSRKERRSPSPYRRMGYHPHMGPEPIYYTGEEYWIPGPTVRPGFIPRGYIPAGPFARGMPPMMFPRMPIIVAPPGSYRPRLPVYNNRAIYRPPAASVQPPPETETNAQTGVQINEVKPDQKDDSEVTVNDKDDKVNETKSDKKDS